MFITGAYGLGENVVQGTVDPDEFYVFKPTLAAGAPLPYCARKLGGKEVAWSTTEARAAEPRAMCRRRAEDQARFCLTDDEVLALADAAHA